MKKLGKKINYFVKVFLAVGLLFTNVSSISVVFAYEGDETNNDTTETVLTDNPSDGEENKEENLEELEEEKNGEENLENENTNEENTSEENEDLNEENTEEENKEENENLNENETLEENENQEEEKTDENIPGEEVGTGEQTDEDSNTTTEYDYTAMLNQSAADLGLSSAYSFKEVDGEKRLYVINGVNDGEVGQIIDNAFSDVSGEIVEDDVILTHGDEEITYHVYIYNNDYLLELVKAAVGNEDATIEEGDMNGDGKVDAEDAVILNRILNDGFADYEPEESDTKINSRLDAYVNEEAISGEVNVSTGDTFTVEYVLTLTKDAIDTVTGSINYNKDLLSLENVEARNLTTGEVYEGKYLYLGDFIMGSEKENEDGTIEYEAVDYVIIVMTFKALTSGSDTISIDNLGYYYEMTYYEGENGNDVMVVVLSSDTSLESLSIAGQSVELKDGVYEYEITVDEDVTDASVQVSVADGNAEITSIVAPEELAEGENEIKITVTAEDGKEQVYTVKVIRGKVQEEEQQETNEATVSPISYQEDTYDNNNDDEPIIDDGGNKQDDDKKNDDNKEDDNNKEENKDNSKLSRIIIISLILLALAGLIYLIFKDEDEETKKANKDINRFKNDDITNEKKVNNKNKKVDKNHKKGR